EWRALFEVEDQEGNPMPLEALPSGIVLTERRPSHANLRVVWPDGRRRALAVTAFPLFSRAAEFEGAVIVFWEEPGAAAGCAFVQARIWGCRGSLATPGPETLRYGGNASCIEGRRDGAVL